MLQGALTALRAARSTCATRTSCAPGGWGLGGGCWDAGRCDPALAVQADAPGNDSAPDFGVPLRVREQGYRVVYQPDALLYEDALAATSDEYAPRVRVALRAFQDIWRRRWTPRATDVAGSCGRTRCCATWRSCSRCTCPARRLANEPGRAVWRGAMIAQVALTPPPCMAKSPTARRAWPAWPPTLRAGRPRVLAVPVQAAGHLEAAHMTPPTGRTARSAAGPRRAGRA